MNHLIIYGFIIVFTWASYYVISERWIESKMQFIHTRHNVKMEIVQLITNYNLRSTNLNLLKMKSKAELYERLMISNFISTKCKNTPIDFLDFLNQMLSRIAQTNTYQLSLHNEIYNADLSLSLIKSILLDILCIVISNQKHEHLVLELEQLNEKLNLRITFNDETRFSRSYNFI